jgi:hypothetical protein
MLANAQDQSPITSPDAAPAQPKRNRGPGRPFIAGQGPSNPGGKMKVGRRYQEVCAALEADLVANGVPLSAAESVLLGQIVALVVRSERTKDALAVVRLSNASGRLLRALSANRPRKPPPATPTLQLRPVPGDVT